MTGSRWVLVALCLGLGTPGAQAAVVIVEKGTARTRLGDRFVRVQGSVDVKEGDVVRVEPGSDVLLEFAEGCKIPLAEGETIVSGALCPNREQAAFGKRFNGVGADASMLSTLAPPYTDKAYNLLENLSGDLLHGRLGGVSGDRQGP